MTELSPIYLDANATTPVDPRVLEAMRPYFTTHFGNPASRAHAYGKKAAEAVALGRMRVAAILGAGEDEIVFTSGATESINLALKGAVASCRDKGNHIITGLTEHKAVLDVVARLETEGVEVTRLAPDRTGRVAAEQVAEAITDRTILISLMIANNETGTLHPIAEIGRLAKSRGILFHTDATQAVGRIPLDVNAMGVDLLSLSAHKIYGPKGVGALYVRRRNPCVRLVSQIDGGGHERGMRSGTLNVPGIVGLGAAAQLCQQEMDVEAPRLAVLRDRLHAGLAAGLDGIVLNGHPTDRLPNTLNVSFAFTDAEALLAETPEVAASAGSACTSAVLEPSHVLSAMGLPDDLAGAAVRFSLSRFTTEDEIDHAVAAIVRTVRSLRGRAPAYERARSLPKMSACNCEPGMCSPPGS
jgi:cysteine desulfurase